MIVERRISNWSYFINRLYNHSYYMIWKKTWNSCKAKTRYHANKKPYNLALPEHTLPTWSIALFPSFVQELKKSRFFSKWYSICLTISSAQVEHASIKNLKVFFCVKFFHINYSDLERSNQRCKVSHLEPDCQFSSVEIPEALHFETKNPAWCCWHAFL